MTPLLSVHDLHLHFHTLTQAIHALRGVSFELYPGETLAIVGESGSGKSALLKAIAKLHPRSTQIQGKVLFQQQSLLDLQEKEIQSIRGKEIGMIFQDPMTSLNPTVKVLKQVRETILCHQPKVSLRSATALALSVLQAVGISEERAHDYPHTLSGGMRQRVMIALALAVKPTLLLADEPTTALDVTIQAQIMALLKKMQQEMGIALLFVTHDLSLVAAHCDRVLILYAGHIVETGTVFEIFQNPKHPYTQALLQSIPRIHQPKTVPLVPIEGFPPDLSKPLPGCPFASRCRVALAKCHTQEPVFMNGYKCWKAHD